MLSSYVSGDQVIFICSNVLYEYQWNGSVAGLCQVVQGSFNQGKLIIWRKCRNSMFLYGITCNCIFKYQGKNQMEPDLDILLVNDDALYWTLTAEGLPKYD